MITVTLDDNARSIVRNTLRGEYLSLMASNDTWAADIVSFQADIIRRVLTDMGDAAWFDQIKDLDI